MNFHPEGCLYPTAENQAAIQSVSGLTEAMYTQRILEAKAYMCDSHHNLIIDFGFMKGVIPRNDGAIGIREGTTRDIAILSKVNHPVSFVVTGFAADVYQQQYAVLSRRKAQELCMAQYVKRRLPGDVIDAVITHIEPFGVFADIGCGIVSLLPIDAISVSRIDHPAERFRTGMQIRCVVKTIENDRITLTHKELLGTWQENACQFRAGETVSGVIRSVESYGVFVELTPNLAGLAERKEEVFPGQQASVFIKSILPERMKVKLIIIEAFPKEQRQPSLPTYFFSGAHMERFQYSPLESAKEIITIF